jgi:hypothetical protein
MKAYVYKLNLPTSNQALSYFFWSVCYHTRFAFYIHSTQTWCFLIETRYFVITIQLKNIVLEKNKKFHKI